MIPDLFIWIEFRGIARKIGQRDCSLALFGKSVDCPRGVIGSVIGIGSGKAKTASGA
jgi:hypothetical protein